MATEKHARTIRLTPDIYDRLNLLCDHLGVTPNSYIIQAIGKSVSKDELTFKAQQNQKDMFSQLAQLMDDVSVKEHQE